MVEEQLGEARRAPLDQAAWARLGELDQTVRSEYLPPGLAAELGRLAPPVARNPLWEGKRVAQVQLVGWLEGLHSQIWGGHGRQHSQPGAGPGDAASRLRVADRDRRRASTWRQTACPPPGILPWWPWAYRGGQPLIPKQVGSPAGQVWGSTR